MQDNKPSADEKFLWTTDDLVVEPSGGTSPADVIAATPVDPDPYPYEE